MSLVVIIIDIVSRKIETFLLYWQTKAVAVQKFRITKFLVLYAFDVLLNAHASGSTFCKRNNYWLSFKC